MKQLIKISVLFLIFNTVYSQNATVEKSIFNYQIGLLGIWVNNESRLSNSITLKSELGVDGSTWAGTSGGGYALAPNITFEPRWYYNLKTRFAKGRDISNNAANFFSLKASYYPDLFVISSDKDQTFANQISLIPKWGFRRNFGKSNFNYELGLGIGYRYYFLKEYGYTNNHGEIATNMTFRLGYVFGKSKK